MRGQAPLACLCFLVLLSARVGARFTYQDLSVPEDGIQGFSITQTFDDNDSWADVTQSSDGSFDTEQYLPARAPGASFSMSRLVDSLYDTLFTPRVRTMDYIIPPDAVSMPFPSRPSDVWTVTHYPSGTDVIDTVDAVGPGDLFRQLSLARFAPQRYRVYVVPVVEHVEDNEPSLDELLQQLDEETDFVSRQLDWFAVNQMPAPPGVATADPSYGVSSDASYDAAYNVVPDATYDVAYDVSSDRQYDDVIAIGRDDYDTGSYEYEPLDYGDDFYRDVYDDGSYADTVVYDYDTGTVSRDVQSDPYVYNPIVGNQLPANPRSRYEALDDLPFRSVDEPNFDSMYEHGCKGFWSHLSPANFNIWTTLLCIACVGMWVYVFVEYQSNSASLRSAMVSRRSDDGSDDGLGSPSDAKAPLLPLKGEFDGVEAADVYKAYTQQYWQKVQHARDHAAPAATDYTLKSYAQP